MYLQSYLYCTGVTSRSVADLVSLLTIVPGVDSRLGMYLSLCRLWFVQYVCQVSRSDMFRCIGYDSMIMFLISLLRLYTFDLYVYV